MVLQCGDGIREDDRYKFAASVECIHVDGCYTVRHRIFGLGSGPGVEFRSIFIEKRRTVGRIFAVPITHHDGRQRSATGECVVFDTSDRIGDGDRSEVCTQLHRMLHDLFNSVRDRVLGVRLGCGVFVQGGLALAVKHPVLGGVGCVALLDIDGLKRCAPLECTLVDISESGRDAYRSKGLAVFETILAQGCDTVRQRYGFYFINMSSPSHIALVERPHAARAGDRQLTRFGVKRPFQRVPAHSAGLPGGVGLIAVNQKESSCGEQRHYGRRR